MDEFSKTLGGRLMALSVGVALAIGGIAALMRPSGEASFMTAAAVFLPVGINIIALPLAAKKYWMHAVVSVIAAGGLMLVYSVWLGTIRNWQPQMGYLLLALSLVGFGFAARPAHKAFHGHLLDQH